MNYSNILETESIYNRFNKFKILAHAENIERLLKNKASKPIIVDLELSNFCNHHCIWCEPLAYRMQNQKMLSPETIKQAIESIALLGPKMVRFCGGGEPMTNPFFGQSLQLAKQKGFGVICNSNGSFISKYIDILLDYCDYFRVSLDAASFETHHNLHQTINKDNFNDILHGLSTLIDKRAKKSNNIEIGIAFLIHYENYMEIPKFTKLMQEIGADFVHFRPVYLPSNVENQKLVNIINKALEMVSESKKKIESKKFKVFGMTRKMSGVWFKRHWRNCYSPFFLPVLGANGNIYACCDRRDLCLGNFEKDGFAKIYQSNSFKEKIKSIDLEKCTRCTNSDLNEVIYYCFEQDYLKKDLL